MSGTRTDRGRCALIPTKSDLVPRLSRLLGAGCLLYLALALQCLASAAFAATKFISPTGTATWADASSSGTPASIYTANTQAVAGDLIIAQAGTYPFRIKPRRSGTAGNNIVYAGAEGSPTSAVFPGITFGDSSNSEGGPLARGNHITVKWVSVSGTIVLGTQALSGGGTNVPTGDSLHVIEHTDTGTMTLHSRLLSATYITTATRQVDMYGTNGGFFFGPNVLSHWQADAVNTTGSDFQYFRLGKVHGLSITDSRFYVTNAAPSAGYSFFLETYGCRNVDFARNHVVYRDSSNAESSTKIYWAHRDSSQFIRIVDNDMDFGGPTASHFRLSHSGSQDCCNRGIRLEHNNIRLRNITSTFAAMLADVGTRADTVRFNLIESWGGTAGFRTQNTVDSLLFAHNTIVHDGQQAIRLQASSTTGSRAVANIAYSRDANGTADGTAVVYAHESIGIDSLGTVFSPGGNSAGGIYRSTSGVGTPGSGSAFGISGKTVWGSPRFVDSTSTSLDAGISSVGYARTPTSPCLHDGFSGAFSDEFGSRGDVTAPAASILGGTAGRNTIIVSWTAPGDDSSFACSGSASTYELRYSTSTIDNSNFNSASLVPGTPSPSAPGTAECVLLEGLDDCTTYYFAIKTQDEAGNWSVLSNVKSLATKCSGSLAVECGSGKSGARTTGPSKPVSVLTFGRAMPNPSNAQSSVQLVIPEHLAGEQMDVGVFDLGGRRVAVLAEGTAVPGERTLVWDLRDRTGVLVRPGLYLARLRIGGETRTQTMVVGR